MLYHFLCFARWVLDVNYKILRVLWKFWNTLDTYHEAFWLSVLPVRQLEGLVRSKYKHSRRYRLDATTRQGLSEWEHDLVLNHLTRPSTITMIGAGGGREVYALVKLGHNVKACEMDLGMVKYAQKFFKAENIDVSFKHLPANQVPGEACDVFWFGWGVYTHFIGQDNRVKLLRAAKESLEPNGKIFISYWRESRNQNYIDRLERITNRIGKRTVERGESLRGGFWCKYYTKDQIAHEAQMAGLRVDFISHESYGHAVLVPIVDV
jgi:SAM-dependent methyltransferase